MKWYRQHKTSSLLILGILIGAQFLVKQNIAIAELVLINLLVILKMDGIRLLIKRLLYLNVVWILITAVWVLIFFSYDGFTTFYEFINFNQRYLSLYPFTYPPLTYLFEPTGFFKLLPYYLPIFFFILLIIGFIRKKLDKKQAVFFLPLIGFFTTIYPTSDLLHVYPYLGLMLVGLYLYAKDRKTNFKFILYGLVITSIVIGFYLTLFREYYRYDLPYKYQNVLIDLPKSQGIYSNQDLVKNIENINKFVINNTKTDDSIFIYSFSPLLYFLLERQNPSEYSIYFPGYLSDIEEREIIKDIYQNNVEFVLTDSFSISDQPLSKWIYRNEKVESFGQFSIFRVDPVNLP